MQAQEGALPGIPLAPTRQTLLEATRQTHPGVAHLRDHLGVAHLRDHPVVAHLKDHLVAAHPRATRRCSPSRTTWWCSPSRTTRQWPSPGAAQWQSTPGATWWQPTSRTTGWRPLPSVLGARPTRPTRSAGAPGFPGAGQPPFIPIYYPQLFQPPAPPRLKIATPENFTGKPKEAKKFMTKCDTYFQFYQVPDYQKVLYALQLITGDASHWKATLSYNLRVAQVPPLWSLDWHTFQYEFLQRWADPMEAQKAMDRIMDGKIKQVTSVRDFMDNVVETCQDVGWLDQNFWRELVLKGLKREVAIMAGPYFPMAWDEFRTHLILCDEQLQRQKVKESAITPKKPTPSNQPSTSTPKKDPKPKIDNSKFKLSEAEKKEHVDQGLCFKCHKKGHNSKDCKGVRTVYSEVKKKAPVAEVHVANIEEQGTESDFLPDN